MVKHRLVEAVLGGPAFSMPGDGDQIRDLMFAFRPGDLLRTGGWIDRSRWEPEVDLRAGLAQQVEWHQQREPAPSKRGRRP